MNIADTTNYTIRVNNDIYYILNKTNSDLEYTLYKQNQSLTLVQITTTIPALEEVSITFDGDGTYKVYIGDDIVEIRYYLQLQSSLITSIGDFLCDCCDYTKLDDCSCSTPIEIKCVQFSAIPLMILSYQHLVDYCLNSCCASQYLYNAVNEYEYILRESYLGHIQEECIKGKSLYGSKGLRFITSIYYVLFLEGELEARDSSDADFIYSKFDYDRIVSCLEDLGLNYNKLKEIMGLCDNTFALILDKLNEVDTKVDILNTTINNVDESVTDVQDSLSVINTTVNNIGDTVENCCDSPVLAYPVADAGDDVIVDVDDTVMLDGTGSVDNDGTIVSYLWTVVSSPTSVTMATPTTATNNVSGLTVEGTYTFLLTVTDNNGLVDTDTVTITVGSAVPTALNVIAINNRAGVCDGDYTFSLTDFLYTPSEYTLSKVKITNVDALTIGTLTYDGVAVTAPLEIDIADIGLLLYTPDETETAQYSELFSFSLLVDENATYSNIASMTVTNTSCATSIPQIQLKTSGDVDMNCGNVVSLSIVPTEDLTSTYIFKIANEGDASLVGTIGIGGTHASRYSVDSSVISVAAAGTQTITVTVDVSGLSGITLLGILTITTNSDVNPTCKLYVNQPVSEVASPPVTAASEITIPRDTTCTDIKTFSSTDFAYTSGSPAGRTHIKITSLPSTGVLTYDGNVLGVDIGVPLTISEANIGLLTYTPDGTLTGATSVTFDVVSSNNNGVTWG